MADRNTFNGSSTDVPWVDTVSEPEGFGNQYARHIGALYDAAAFPLTSVGGTADDVTASLDPVLDGGTLVDGMKFTLTWASSNTGPMTLAINGVSPVNVLTASGGAMIAGGAEAGSRALLEFIAGNFRIIGAAAGGGSGGGSAHYEAFTVSGTWTKPAGYPDDHMVRVQMWAGGTGGAEGQLDHGAGGVGGAYVEQMFRYDDVPASVSVTVGSGGAGGATGAGSPGGATSFGALLTVEGESVQDGVSDPHWDGGAANTPAIWGGAGGAGDGVSTPPAGQIVSRFGGNGGSTGNAGVAPGGGGGGGASGNNNGGDGARGEVRVWL